VSGSEFWLPYWVSKADADEPEASGRSTATPADTFLLLADACHALKLQPQHTLLDVGCGPGALGKHLLDHCRYRGVDPVSRTLDRWERGRGNVRPGEITDLPFKDGRFERILASGVIQYLSVGEVFKGLQELRRVIVPEGLCFLQSVPCADSRDEYLKGCPPERRELNLKATWFEIEPLGYLAKDAGWRRAQLWFPDRRLWLAPYYFDMLLEA